MYTIKINGVDSYINLNSYVDFLNSPIPNKIENRINIEGKNGTVLVDTNYDDRIVNFKMLVKFTGNFREKLREVVDYLDINNEVLLNFTIDDKIFYTGIFNNLIINKLNHNSIELGITYNCSPYIYKIINENIDLETIFNKEDIENLTLNTDYLYEINPI